MIAPGDADNGGTALTRTDAAKGTTFAGNKGHIDSNNGTFYQLTSSLPDNALSLYTVDDQSAVTAIPWGKGQIIFLAWDWYDAKPDFDQNGGWLDVLASAVSRTDRAILGTSGDDILDGGSLLVGQATISSLDDKILGLRGNDIIDGWGGDDAIFGGPGADVLYGGPGFDKLHGSRGNDTFIDVEDGAKMWGGPGHDSFDFSGYDPSFIKDFRTGVDEIVLNSGYFVRTGRRRIGEGRLSQGVARDDDRRHPHRLSRQRRPSLRSRRFRRGRGGTHRDALRPSRPFAQGYRRRIIHLISPG